MPLHSLFYADDFHLKNEPQHSWPLWLLTDIWRKQQAHTQSILPLKISRGKNTIVPVTI